MVVLSNRYILTKDNVVVATVYENSIQDATEFFAMSYTGQYVIVYALTEEEYIVTL